MRDRDQSPVAGLLVSPDSPLIGIFLKEDDQEVARYFADESAVDRALSDEDLETSLKAIGRWSDLEWDEMVDELERIRHENSPTPPIDL